MGFEGASKLSPNPDPNKKVINTSTNPLNFEKTKTTPSLPRTNTFSIPSKPPTPPDPPKPNINSNTSTVKSRVFAFQNLSKTSSTQNPRLKTETEMIRRPHLIRASADKTLELQELLNLFSEQPPQTTIIGVQVHEIQV